MQAEFRQAKMDEIQANADRQKTMATFLIGLIENDEDRIRPAFLNEEESSRPDVDNILYNRVKEIIRDLAYGQSSGLGGIKRYFQEDDALEEIPPVIQMGWMEREKGKRILDPDSYQPVTMYNLHLTAEGITVIDGYCLAAGLQRAIGTDTPGSGWQAAVEQARYIPLSDE